MAMISALRSGAIFLMFFAVFIGLPYAYAQDGALLPPGDSDSPYDGLISPGLSLPGANDIEEGGEEGDLDLFSGLDEPEKTPEEIEAEIREQAFNAALAGLLPMRPNEIRKLLEYYDKTEEAIQKPLYPYPEPELAVRTVSLDPGATLPVVKTAMGHVTTLAVLDVTGAPWPVFDLAYAGPFEVQSVSDTNVLRITPTEEFAHGNISLQMVGLKTPVIVTLEASRDIVHYRFDIRVPEYGPAADVPLIEGGISISAGSTDMAAVLDGVPPAGAKKMDVTGVDGRTTAYVFNSNTYVRTPMTLLSPGWMSSVSSADGMNVYKLGEAPVILLSDKGKMVRAHISEKVEDNE